MKKNLLYILVLSTTLLFLLPNKLFAKSADFVINSDTNISYTTGNTYVSVTTKYTRSVKNNDYYYPASGEKVFNIPDLPNTTTEEIKTEREFKLKSLKVTTASGTSVKYTIEQLDDGQGIYIKIPNYKQTTYSSPYIVQLTYNTHDYVTKIVNFVTLQAPALPSDIQFEQTDTSTNTLTEYNYGMSITVDKNIGTLAKVYPSNFTQSSDSTKTTYTFTQEDRIENSPYLEFGTSVMYKFKLTYTTPKTDSLIPEQYTNLFKALSTNIFEISLPREFDETNQKVYFTNVSPTPSNITRDSEGNILASFEVPSNQVSTIDIEGYIVVNQPAYKEIKDINMEWSSYQNTIKSSSYLNTYLGATKYWQVSDNSIQQAAANLLENASTVMDVIKADYNYVDEKLTYDTTKANSENNRLGAVEALKSGSGVCMEYADAMIAILRAQGIPARAALGYANLEESETSQVRHQWVQVWIPDYGWLSVDPTLESNNMKIGASIDRVLWEVFNGDTLSNIRVFSADNINVLTTEGYDISIYGVDSSTVNLSSTKSYVDLVPDKGYSSTDDIPQDSEYSAGNWVNTFLKTTTVGKSILITGPIILFVLVLSILIFTISTVVRRIKKKKESKKYIS